MEHSEEITFGECAECEELLEHMAQYLDGELTEELRRELVLHAQSCRNCAHLLRTMERLVAMCQLEPNCEMPEAIRQELWVTIRAELQSDGGPPA
jgi:anti-sigma factor RsiW